MIIDIFLPLSLIFIMFTLGLGLTLNDFINLVHTPKAFFPTAVQLAPVVNASAAYVPTAVLLSPVVFAYNA